MIETIQNKKGGEKKERGEGGVGDDEGTKKLGKKGE